MHDRDINSVSVALAQPAVEYAGIDLGLINDPETRRVALLSLFDFAISATIHVRSMLEINTSKVDETAISRWLRTTSPALRDCGVAIRSLKAQREEQTRTAVAAIEFRAARDGRKAA